MFSVLHAVVGPSCCPMLGSRNWCRISTHLIAQNQWDGSSLANILDWDDQSETFAGITFYRRTAVTMVTFGRD